MPCANVLATIEDLLAKSLGRPDTFKRRFRIVPIDVKIQVTKLTAVIIAGYRRG
jgi:hypothetical protein